MTHIIPYPHLDETLYAEQLPNGLRVYVLPKKGFQKTYATFTTQYGSIDNRFQVGNGEVKHVPDGIAHFLEHKMFEEPTGDIFAEFAAQGASANAFTTFDTTTYLFSATSNIEKNIETLLNFVQNPYFTEESVEKEKGIINQEINMYKDNADWQVYFGLIESLYQAHPIYIDIAGTNDSIMEITKDMLYDCYHTFYHPTNMTLFVAGGVDAEAILSLVRENQARKQFAPQGEIKRLFPEEPPEVRRSEHVKHLHISMPKCLIGFKDTDVDLTGAELLQKECEMKLLFDIMFSSSSNLYRTLYDEQLITDNFDREYSCSTGYGYSAIGGDTKDPQQYVQRIIEEIEKVKKEGVSASSFERNRKRRVGNFLRMLNSTEAIAHHYPKYLFREIDLFDMIKVYDQMTIEQINERLQHHFNAEQMSVSIIRSASDG